MGRKANTKCTICSKPLYRRPHEFKEGVEFCCSGCRSELYKRREMPEELKLGWELTWKIGENHKTGIPKSEETKKKISEANKRYWSNNKDKAKERGLKQSKNSNRKSELGVLIRTSLKYKEWVKQVFERDNYTCQECGDRSSKEKHIYLNAHHIKPLSLIMFENNLTTNDFDTLQKAFIIDELWDINNGKTLCIDCHKKVHKRNNIYIRRKKNVDS